MDSFLRNQGIKVTLVDSWAEILMHAARKLLWASSLWLLCHESSPSEQAAPLTVVEVHDKKDQLLRDLVEELLPVVRSLTQSQALLDDDLKETLDYMECYSRSMPGAIPNKELAIAEVAQRNGIWLKKRDDYPQPLHESLLERVVGSDELDMAMQAE